MGNFSQRAAPEEERTATLPLVGATNLGGPLQQNPVIAIFDNQSTVPVAVSFSGILWKTFSAGEALVLDMRGNDGKADNFTFDIGTQFQTTSTGGTGTFRLSILYAR
jgi:hypothetical protein